MAFVNLNKSQRLFLEGDVICQEGDKIKEFLYLKDGILKIEGKSFEILDVELLEKIRELG